MSESNEAMLAQLRGQAENYSVRSVGNIPLTKADIHHLKTNRLEWKAAKLIDDLQAENERLRKSAQDVVDFTSFAPEAQRIDVWNLRIKTLANAINQKSNWDFDDMSVSEMKIEIKSLREALRRYGDKFRMGTVEPMSVQQAIDRALGEE